MKLKKRALAFATAALLAVETLPAVPASAALDLENLPTPIAAESANAFRKKAPELSVKEGYYGYKTLSWTPVDGALYYKVYQKPEGGTYNCIGMTFDTGYAISAYVTAEYKVRAVTFTYEDEKVTTIASNIVKVKAKAEEQYKNYLDGAEDDYAEYEEEAADDEVNYVSTGDGAVNTPMEYYEDYPYIEYNTEEYSHDEESGYKQAATDPLSTFSADVDTASYANLRRLINNGDNVPADAVRIEEMLNYFDYDYKAPAGNSRFTINTELTDCPWNNGSQLVSIGIQGADIAETPASNLVFLVDTSGSMYSEDKLELAVKSIRILAKTMTENDRISIVTYSGEERVVLAGARGNQIKTITGVTSVLDADGCTYGEGGINAAYAIAEKYYIEGGNNRIIMMTDGDLNVGISSEEELQKLIEEKRESGVYFSVMGFGTGNIKDNKMETLADNGNGSYHYIDSVNEARKIFESERSSTLYTIAKDVKIQVEFNPECVKSYRLIGYDNRRLANEDFTDDTKDAGEVGAGSSVTALYEIIPAEFADGASKRSDMLTVKVRYKNPDNGKSYQVRKVVTRSDYSAEMSDNMKLACAVTEFGLVLKGSEYKGTANLSEALELAQSLKEPDLYEKELAELIKKYKNYSGK